MTNTTLPASTFETLGASLDPIHEAHARRHPGQTPARQPVHTVYGGAHLFSRDLVRKLGRRALATVDTYARDPFTFARAVGLADAESLPPHGTSAPDTAAARLAETVWQRVRDKLEREPVEDFRIDFEDGYGHRPDVEEDETAAAAAAEVAAGLDAGTLPPFLGIRIKSFGTATRRRAILTLDRFLTALVRASGGRLPPSFVVTLPKIVHPAEVAALDSVLGDLERALDIEAGRVRIELMVETPQSLIDAGGRAALPRLVDAAGGRCVGAHFGVYDYTAGLDIAAAHQTMDHPACDEARHWMQISLAGTGIHLSDGATNVMPVAPHRGNDLDAAAQAENRRRVQAGWALHARHVRHSLTAGFYQGWDLHPAQLPSRYAAVYGFFLEGLDAASARLSKFVGQAAQATLLGDVFDDAATGQGLLNVFLRGLACGALTEDEALATGLSLEELHSRSFLAILDGRRRAEG